jgi:hypothetical protein
MKIPHRLGVSMVIAAGLVAGIVASETHASDLAQILISNSQQGELTAGVVGQAIMRRGNTFIAPVDEAGQLTLREAGVPFQIVMTDVELSELYYVPAQSRSIVQQSLDWETVGQSVTLGDDRRIVQMSRAMAASLAEGYRLGAVPSCNRNVPVSYVPPAAKQVAPEDFRYDTLAILVNQDSIYAYNKRLEDFHTRYVFTDSVDRARDWLEDKFQSFGYHNVTVQPFWHSSWAGTGYGYNVIAVKEGSVEPDQVVLIGAHYDSYSTDDAFNAAPGADDDASGVALVLELARILNNVPLRKTVMFVAFSAEEQWMYGSGYMADEMHAAGTKLEAMFNYDMVAYTADTYWDLDVHSEYYDIYRAVTHAAAERVTLLHPVVQGMSRPGDNYPFEDLGYPTIRVEESDFNTPNYHKVTDLCSQINFPYLAEVTKMALVALASVADAPYPSTVERVLDVGDGHSLQVHWSECSSDCSYRVYWGSTSGDYTDSVLVPAGECSYTVTGLPQDQVCFMTVYGVSQQGARSLYGVEGSGIPYLYPRPPRSLTGAPSPNQLQLTITWRANEELDFSYYRIYRRYGTAGSWRLYQDVVTSTTYIDTDILPHVGYEYAITAVDQTGYESGMSSSVLIYPATFDGGPVVADGFVMDHEYDPDQAEQHAWLDTIFGAVDFAVAPSDENGGPLSVGTIGQYGTLIWIDDDVIYKNIAQSNAALDEFSKHGTNMMISGFQTWFTWAAKSVPTSHLLYREFGLASYDYTSYFDFIGAVGQNGWPSVAIDPKRGMNEWSYIPKLTPRAGGQVILRFDSQMDLPEWEGQPVGMVYQTANGKRVLLSFPLYYLTPASATALMARIFEYFTMTSDFDKGDLDHSGTVDIGDVSILIDHLFINLRPLAYPEEADVDSRAGVSIGDVMYLINYLFMGGPSPAPRP